MSRHRFLFLTISSLAAASAFYVGCGGDDTTSPNNPSDAGKDSTTDGSNPADSTPPPDVNQGDTSPPPADAGAHGKVVVLHASPDAPAIRFCFGLNTGSGMIMGPTNALPNAALPGQPYAGLFPGTGGAVPDLIDLATVEITPYIIPAQSIAGETPDGGPDGGKEDDCSKLLGADGNGGILTAGQYFKLAPIAKGTIAHDTTTLIAAVGCVPTTLDMQANKARCGADYDGTTGNLKAVTYRLDRTVADNAKIGVQVIHAASAWDGVFAAQTGGAVTQVTALVQRADGGVLQVVNPPPAGITFGQQAPDASVPTAASNLDPAGTAFVVNTAQADGGTALTFGLPLGTIAQLTAGASVNTATYYAAGNNYVFVLLGDPTAQQLVADGGPNPAYDGQGLHVVAFPTNPTLPTTF